MVLALNARRAGELFTDMSEGARNAVLPTFNTASEVGFGAIIASLAAFNAIRDGIFGVSDNALVTSAATSGVTGSASGGMTIALGAVGEQLTAMAQAQAQAQAQGIDMELMHRATAMARSAGTRCRTTATSSRCW